ncbi:ATP-binding protein [bacterium]|nr:ATP-binding protein [bacterium]
MEKEWDQEIIQHYIDNGIEESTGLEYKGADSLDKSDGKKKEIAKDVSGMANASGGLIFYGIQEYQEKSHKHKPEKIDPIDRTQYSKEWLEQVIASNIQPPISGFTIYPVPINTGTDHVVYVVEVPQSMTAHQVTQNKDYRYYIRLNFEVIPMEDYQIRDVMNRANKPDVVVEFKYIVITDIGSIHEYKLGIKIINKSHLLVNHCMLEFSFPDLKKHDGSDAVMYEVIPDYSSDKIWVKKESGSIHVVYRSDDVLFPKQEKEIGDIFTLQYKFNRDIFNNLNRYPKIKWTLYADDMIPKNGEMSVPHCF